MSDAIEKDEQDILHVTLRGLLPEEMVLAFHRKHGFLSLLACCEGMVALLAQEQFTDTEIRLLLPLLQTYPSHCPYKQLETVCKVSVNALQRPRYIS